MNEEISAEVGSSDGRVIICGGWRWEGGSCCRYGGRNQFAFFLDICKVVDSIKGANTQLILEQNKCCLE